MVTKIKSVISPDNDSVVTEIHIAAPPARVWKALTTSEQLMLWFTDAVCPTRRWDMDARLGGQYQYITEKGAIGGHNVTEFECHGEILEFDPPRILAYTWIANWHADKLLRTIVRWKLTPDGIGTRVKITHSGLLPEEESRKDYTGGWPGVVEMLKQFVEKPAVRESAKTL